MTHGKRMIPTAPVQVKHIGLFRGVVRGIELSRNKGDWEAGPAHENLGTLCHAGGLGHTIVRGRSLWCAFAAGSECC